MPLEQGARFGPYEIVAPIGAGGMGEVYKARDTRLDRTVALKILPPHIAAREDFRARFEREARAVSSLNHPHICTLFDVGKQDGVEFLVMEHLEGETLADRLERGPLPPDQAVNYAIQIADAVDRAHRKGIVHRDLKPGNIMLTRDGIKVLDFGLARTASAAAAAGVTMTKPLTTEGSVLGTPHYMSPEQIEGRDADTRTDIFAFGCVVYEMVAGRRAFDGNTTASVIGAVMSTQPPAMRVLQPLTPGALESIVTGCLVKDADLRYQSLWDVLIELRKVTAHTGDNAAVERKRTWLPWAAAVVLGVTTIAVSTAYFRKAPLDAATVRFNIDPPDGFSGAFQLSPNGRYLAMVSQRKLWIRELGSLEAKAVDGVEDPSYPFWSPDSAAIGFVAQQRLKAVTLAGGRIRTICDPGSDRTRGASWSNDGTIIFSAPTGIRSVPADGGTPVNVTQVPSGGTDVHRYPAFLPDGRHFLFLHQSGNADKGGIYVGSLDGGAPVRVLPDQENPSYAPATPPHKDGYLIFRRENTLMAQPFNAEALRTEREAFPIADGVGLGTNARLGAFTVSANGVLAYRAGRGQLEEITWFDRTGTRLQVAAPEGDIATFAIAPNQKQFAVSRLALEKGIRQHDIWLEGEVKGATSRFTYGPPPGWSYPIWSPDGKYLIYGTANEVGVANYEIHSKPATMVGQHELLLRSSAFTMPYDISPDGKWLLYMSDNSAWLLPLQGDRKPVRLAGAFDRPANFMQFSPDGRFLAYAERNPSGGSDIYVQPFPATGAKWQLSLTGGNAPHWRKDGKELFFEAPDGKLMAVSISGGAALQHGAPEPLFPIPPGMNDLYYHYQPSPDGRRFMVISPAAGTKPSPITVALNWQSELKK